MKKSIILAFLFLSLHSLAQTNVVNIVPKPVSLELHSGNFNFTPETIIIAGSREKAEAEMLNLYLKKLYGFTLPVKTKTNTKTGNTVTLTLLKSGERKDAYNLEVDSKKITISSKGNEGLFYGVQTLLQLLPSSKLQSETTNLAFEVPQLSIKDYPRFQYRGMHLDVARHFFDVDFVKKYLDYMAYHKFNNFHWHLTEDQGWRIEIKKYPLLTSVGGFRNGTIIGHHPGTGNDSIRYGGFYTQEQIKEIVKYAKDRFITVIPEIELPGHASAAIAAYPQLSCFPNESTKISPKTSWAGSREGKQVQQTWGVFEDVFAPTEYTFTFLENVLDEVLQLFPSKYIHIGGDECPKTNWERSAFCQELIKEKGLKDEHGLQSYFIQRIEKYLNSKGRKIIGWDEILEGGLAPNATVMSWRGEEGGIAAAKQNHDVIMTPGTYCYFDHSQTKNKDSVTIGGYLPLETVYNYEPVPKELNADEAKYVLGAQANVWTEYMGYPSKVEYMIFPRMSALSEVLWSPKESRDWSRFSSELTEIYKRYKFWGANYYSAEAISQ
ncbi:MAG TPA: beta-N-acetylhexosaminidase [Hanamia sp.]